MIFYHGTTKSNYELIKQEGFLWGKRNAPSRCTYLASSICEAEKYGDVILEVEYNPYENKIENNYIDDCWQFRVYEPISIDNIKIL